MDFEIFKKIVESCHLNFLIGSGASKPFLGTLGEIENLLTDLAKSNIEKDERTVLDSSIKKKYWDVAIKGNMDIYDSNRGKLKITKQNYSEFYNSVNTILLKRKTNLISKQANVFTTNMDLFNEYTIESLQFVYNDGFSGRIRPVFSTSNFSNSVKKTTNYFEYQSELPLFNLYKLHGSLNWMMSDNEEVLYDNNLMLLETIHKIIIPTEDLLEIEYSKEVDGKEQWFTFSIEELYKNLTNQMVKKKKVHSDFLAAYDKLVMINPTKEKFESTTRKLVFYELLRMYSNILEKENSVLFVLGFSFADEHIREITLRVAKANPTLLVVIFAHTPEAKDLIEKSIGKRNNIFFIYDENISFSLDKITENYFGKLATELKSGKE